MQVNTEFGNHLRQLRKARGLSQEKFAHLADVSYRHVNFVENSRSMPSREMVLKIATAFELTLKNTNVLLRSAGFSSSYSHTSLDDEAMRFAKAALTRILDHQNPYPGVVMSPIGNLMMANTAVFDVLGQLVPIETLMSATNIYEFFLTNEVIREHLVNWEQIAPKLIELIRQEVFELDTKSEALLLLREMEAKTGINSRNLYEEASPDMPLLNMKFKLDNLELSFFSTYTTFGTPHDIALQDLRIECFYPGDQKTQEFCETVATHE